MDILQKDSKTITRCSEYPENRGCTISEPKSSKRFLGEQYFIEIFHCDTLKNPQLIIVFIDM